MTGETTIKRDYTISSHQVLHLLARLAATFNDDKMWRAYDFYKKYPKTLVVMLNETFGVDE